MIFCLSFVSKKEFVELFLLPEARRRVVKNVVVWEKKIFFIILMLQSVFNNGQPEIGATTKTRRVTKTERLLSF